MDIEKELRFDSRGLIPAIVQDADNGQVLMVGYMDAEALRRTLSTGRTCFFSRSRQTYWVKGETSGNIQKVKAILTDCDQDALVVKVEQVGVACHEGTRSCFARQIVGNNEQEADVVRIAHPEAPGHQTTTTDKERQETKNDKKTSALGRPWSLVVPGLCSSQDER